MNKKTFYTFIAPSLTVMTALMIIPLISSFFLSSNFITYENLKTPQFVGLQNYREILSDPAFWYSVRFTLIYIAITVPIRIFIGFFIAIMLDQITFLRGLCIGLLILPMVISPVVSSMMFRMLFETGGLVNHILRELFNYKFIFNKVTVKIIIIAQMTVITPSFPMIVLFSGLQTLNKNSLEAATIDGATYLQKIRYVVVPHLKSLFVFLFLIQIMDMYRAFENILVLSKGNPLFQSETVMLYNFRIALSYNRIGKGNAIAVLTLIGIIFVLVPFLINTYKEQVEAR